MRTGLTNKKGPEYCSVSLDREHSPGGSWLYIMSSIVASNAVTFGYRKPDTVWKEESGVTEASKKLVAA